VFCGLTCSSGAKSKAEDGRADGSIDWRAWEWLGSLKALLGGTEHAPRLLAMGDVPLAPVAVPAVFQAVPADEHFADPIAGSSDRFGRDVLN
jgi:hypothetical protein